MEAFITTETVAFFERSPGALGLYAALAERVLTAFPDTRVRVQKTQITFRNRHVFACVSFARVRRKAELPSSYFVLTLGLPYPLELDRVAVKCEPYPGRWTTHIVVSSPDELDDELFFWIEQAYGFAEAK